MKRTTLATIGISWASLMLVCYGYGVILFKCSMYVPQPLAMLFQLDDNIAFAVIVNVAIIISFMIAAEAPKVVVSPMLVAVLAMVTIFNAYQLYGAIKNVHEYSMMVYAKESIINVSFIWMVNTFMDLVPHSMETEKRA